MAGKNKFSFSAWLNKNFGSKEEPKKDIELSREEIDAAHEAAAEEEDLASQVESLTAERDTANTNLNAATNRINQVNTTVDNMLNASNIEHTGDDTLEAKLGTIESTLKKWGKTGARAIVSVKEKADEQGDSKKTEMLDAEKELHAQVARERELNKVKL